MLNPLSRFWQSQIVPALRDIFCRLILARFAHEPITVYIEPLDGGEPDDVFVGHVEKVKIVPAGNRAYFEMMLRGPSTPEGYSTLEWIDFKSLKWNRQKARWEARKFVQPVTQSSSSRPHNTSDRESFWRSTMVPSSMKAKQHSRPRKS